MRYVQISSYNYQDHPNEQMIFFGRDSETGLFVHQLVEDKTMDATIPLADAVKTTNDETMAYAQDNGFNIVFGDVHFQRISDIEYAMARQDMEFEDGRHAVQENLYFFDPNDHVFRMMQFGIVPVDAETWTKQSEALAAFIHSTLLRIRSNMSLPENMVQFPLEKFRPVE